jgi:uncharacterized membrane protein
MHRRYPDLLLLLVIAGLTLVVGLSGLRANNIEYETMPVWMAPLGISMVLFIPGYAIVTAVLPNIGSERTLLLSLGLSIAISAIGGILLNLTPWGLTPGTWAIWLSTIAIIGIILAYRQRRTFSQNFEMGVPSLQKENIAIFGLAGFILLISVLIAYISSIQTETTFTQLWAIPNVTPEGRYEVQIGIRNEEKLPEVYNLYIEVDSQRLDEWPTIPLESGSEWITVYQLPEKPNRPIRILLYRINDMNHAYRWLRISPEAFKQP